MKIDRNLLRLSAQRALLFCITPSVRFIFVGLVNEKIVLRVYFENTPTDDEKDLMYGAIGEICGDFVEINDSSCICEFKVSNAKFEDIEQLQHCVFARFE